MIQYPMAETKVLCPIFFIPSWILRFLLLVLAMLAMPGCFGRSQPTGTVSGKVTYKGNPVPAGCLVTFVSDRGVAALGTVDDSGRYKLMTAGKPDVPALNYNIAVTFPGVAGPEMTDEDERKFMAGDPATIAKFGRKPKAAPIPTKYADEFNSGLSYQIKAGPNTFDIDLQ
jgi:hypothetical protein